MKSNKSINTIKLSFKKKIHESGKIFIIAEAGVNHNGSLKIAKSLVDIAVLAKADAVKFQTFSTNEIILKKAPKANYHIETTGSDKKISWFKLLKSQELSYENHLKLLKYCNKKKIIFISTPYDFKSVDLLEKIGVEIFKIASTDADNYQLIEYIAKKRKPVILSTAMTNLKDISKSFQILKKHLGIKNIVIMQCTGSYPAPISDANLRVIEQYKNFFKCLVGYSDHVIGDVAAIAAVSFGISCYEKHITVDKNFSGPDHRTSMEKNEFCNLVTKIRDAECALGSRFKKITKSEENNVNKLKKFLVAKNDIIKGQKIKASDITAKRTGGKGLAASKYFTLINKIAKKNYKINSPF